MFCTQCGHELPPDAKFCTACGAEVKREEKTPPAKCGKRENESKVFERQQEAPKSVAKKVWDNVVTLACFAVLVVGIVSIIMLVGTAILAL